MDIWRLWQVLCIASVTMAHPNPLELLFGIFDEAAHVPGEPLSPIDFQNAESVVQSSPPTDKYHSDPIELAGLFEGDIILSSPKSANNSKNAIKNEKQKWAGGVVPYFISSQFNAVERSVIAKAFAEYQKNTCIKFVPRSSERDYIHITKGNGCSSLVGRVGGAQPVTLGQGCVYSGVVIHELMHAVGFWHEQSRSDRDNYVDVYYKNIQSGMEFNFRKYDWNQIQNLSVPYDTSSVMHYGSYAFSKDKKSATIVPKDKSQRIGQRNTFSKSDILKINRLYQCDKALSQITPPTTPPITGECRDTHKYCPYWAANGECSKNGMWMMVNCKSSCKKCDEPCNDLNQYCGVWASRGDCTRSSSYMTPYCSKSCKSCRTGVSPSLECEDKEKFCPYWANHDECTKNPRFMTKYCPRSCKLC